LAGREDLWYIIGGMAAESIGISMVVWLARGLENQWLDGRGLGTMQLPNFDPDKLICEDDRRQMIPHRGQKFTENSTSVSMLLGGGCMRT